MLDCDVLVKKGGRRKKLDCLVVLGITCRVSGKQRFLKNRGLGKTSFEKPRLTVVLANSEFLKKIIDI